MLEVFVREESKRGQGQSDHTLDDFLCLYFSHIKQSNARLNSTSRQGHATQSTPVFCSSNLSA